MDDYINKDPACIKLTGRQRFDFAVYDMGYMLLYYWVNAFMTIYYTDVIGVKISMVAMLTLVVRVFDAVNDPLIGSLADRTKTKNGRYKPWIRYGGAALAIMIVFMFSANPDWPYRIKVGWMWTTYLLVTIASTCCYMPYMAMNGVLSSDSGERNKLSSLRQVLVNIGGQAAAMMAVPLIMLFAPVSSGAQAAKGYSRAVLLCAVIFVPLAFYTSHQCKEVVTQIKEGKKVSLKLQMACFFKNKYAVLLQVGFLMFGLSQYGRMSILVYYFQYVAKDLRLNTVSGVVTLIACLLGCGFFSDYLYRKTNNKGKAMVIGFAAYGILTIPMYFLPASSFVFWFFLFFSQTAVAAAAGISYGMLGDVVDYGEYRTGIRADGFIAAFISFGQKAGAAIGPALLLLFINHLGYVPNAATQNPAVLKVMTGGISIFLSACSLVAVGAFWRYSSLDNETLARARSETTKSS